MNRMRQRGLLTAELLTATMLLGIIIAGLMASMGGFSRFNHRQWARQRCTAAALAQLDSLTATGRPIEPQELKRLWPDVQLSVSRAPAGPPWAGLELVEVTAVAEPVRVRLARYIQPAPAVAEGGRL
jgi:type II secretory pathway pseudopilin PulG